MSVQVTKSKIIPGEIYEMVGQGEIQRLVTAQAIATEWIMYVDYSNDCHFVLHAPTDGPVDMIEKWANSEQEILVFSDDNKTPNFTSMEEYKAAQDFAVQSAYQEVFDEVNR